MLDIQNIRFQIKRWPSRLGLLFSLGMIAATSAPLLASDEAKQAASSAAQPTEAIPLAAGTYLYGQSSEREEIGKEYLVFEVNGDQIVGASYLPRSEFSCFYGTISSQRIALSLVHPYDGSVYPTSIVLEENASVAVAGEQLPRSVNLIGYHPVGEPNSNDRRILNICLEQYQ